MVAGVSNGSSRNKEERSFEHQSIHTCEKRIDCLHYVFCILHCETHWWFKFQYISVGSICTKKDLMLLQPVERGNFCVRHRYKTIL